MVSRAKKAAVANKPSSSEPFYFKSWRIFALLALILTIFYNLADVTPTFANTVSLSGSVTSTSPTYNRLNPNSCWQPLSGQIVHYAKVQFTLTETGHYTVTVNTNGFQGMLTIYQGFVDIWPDVNCYILSSNIGTSLSLSFDINLGGFPSSTFDAVIAGNGPSDTGTFTGTVSGGTFTLPAATINTGAATGISTNSATLNGSGTGNGLDVTTGFEWGTASGSYPNSVAGSPSAILGSNSGSFSASLGGLTPGTTYYFRAKGTSSAGTAYGSERSFTTFLPPSISGTPPNGTFNTPYNFSFTRGGNPTPTLSVTGGSLPPGLSLSGASITGTPSAAGNYGPITVTASNGYSPDASTTFSINIAKANQTITFTGVPASAAYGSSFTVNASASSGLPVTVTSSGACTNSGTTVTMTSSTGTCNLTASQAGDINHNAAPDATQTTNATKANQTITFTGAPANAAFGSSFTVSASASSGLPVTITSSGACTNTGTSVNMTSGTGACNLTASQAGDSNYNAALDATQTTNATKTNQTVTFTGAPASAVYGSTFTVSASASSGLPVTVTSSGACTNTGNTVTMTSGTGTCNLTATQAGDSNYNVASATQTTSASKANQTVTFTGAPANAAYGSSFTVSASASSGLPVTVSASGACTNSGTTVTMTASSGACNLTASQAGDSNYNPATDATQTTNATKANQTITFTGAPASAAFGSTFTVSASASSGLPVTITSSGGCTNSGTSVTMTSGTGTCNLTASQAGDSNYNPAADATQTTNATKTNQTVTFTGAPANAAYGSTFTVSASASSGLPVTVSASGACTSSGNTVTMTSGTGTCNLIATQAGDSNYNLATATQTTNATRIPLTVTANNQSRVFGAANPAFTVSYSGFLGSDNASSLGGTLVCSTTATSGSPVGNYPISCSGLTSNNYVITFVDGNLNVYAPTITVGPGTLSAGQAGAAYNQSITGNGGTSPYNLAVTGGALPSGLTLATDGTLSGTPTVVGSFNFTVTATDANSFTGSRNYSLTINAPVITLSPLTLANGTSGTAYSQNITGAGGTAPYSFSLTNGALPAGLNLSSGGVVSGTPTTAGTYNFSVTATDSTAGTGSPFTGSQAFTVTVAPGAPGSITATGGTPQSATVGTPFAQKLQATVTDASGNPVSGVGVTFTVNPVGGAGASFAAGTSTTDANGVAISPLVTANTVAGNYTVTANLSSSPLGTGATFNLANLAGAPGLIVAIGGTPQNTTTGTLFVAPLQTRVTDSNNNPIGGATVTFNAPATGPSLVFPGGNTVTTDALGYAVLTVGANNQVGSYQVTATTPGVNGSAVFNLTNCDVVGCGATNIAITKKVDVTSQFVGGHVNYTITISNGGLYDATGLVVQDLLPEGVTYNYHTAPAGTTYDSKTGNWTVGSLKMGQSLSLTINCLVTKPGQITNTATKTHQDQPDNNPAANSASATFLAQQPRLPADLGAQLRGVISGDGTEITFNLTIINFGQGRAAIPYILVPVVPELELVNATFPDKRDWLKGTNGDKLEIRFHDLWQNDSATGSLTFRVKPGAQAGSAITLRFQALWDDDEAVARVHLSNLIRVTVGDSGKTFGAVEGFNPAALEVARGNLVTLSGDFYAPNEKVEFWYTGEDGLSHSLGYVWADQDGKATFVMRTAELPAGTYVVAGKGNHSGVTGKTVVAINNSLQSFTPGQTEVVEGTTVSFQGGMFGAGEQVNIWYTGPDGKTVSLGYLWADENGQVSFELDTTGVGHGHLVVVGYGNRTGIKSLATVKVTD